MSNYKDSIDDIGGVKGCDENVAGDVLQIPEIAIPNGIDTATANLLKMQMATQIAQM
jgi:hypothetical protein